MQKTTVLLWKRHRKWELFQPTFMGNCSETTNKPGTAQVGAVSKAHQIVKFWGEIEKKIGGKNKTLYANFENGISEL